MPVSINNIDVKNELRPEAVDYLLANVGDKITFEITLTVETSVIASTDNPVTFNVTDGLIAPAGTEWIVDDAARFTDFRVGDLIYISIYPTIATPVNATIVEKLDDSTIRIDTPSGIAANTDRTDMALSISTPVTAIDYKYNFVENDEAQVFTSKTSGTEQLLHAESISAAVTTPVAMTFIGKKDYQIGSATIEGIQIIGQATSSPVYKSEFKIIHETIITPIILAEQWDDLLIKKAPNYFFNNKCLKAIFDFEARYTANDPNKIQTVDVLETKGNTGWFNENFNTGLTNYFLDSIVYKDATAATIPGVELSDTLETEVTITIKNTVDSPFFTGSSQKFTLNFCRSPFDAAEYTDNNNLLLENFVFDRALLEEGAAAINGDNFGTGYQVLKDITATTISVTEAKITFKVLLGSDALTAINQSDEKRYLIFVTTQKASLFTKDSDKVALLADARTFYINNSDPEMIVINNKFIRHPHSNPDTQGEPRITVFPEDEVVTYSRFYIDRNGRTTDNISIRSITAKIKAKNPSTLEEFTLDTFTLDTTAYPVINDHQFIDFTLDRVFHIPATEIRKPIKVKRRVDLDTTDLKYFEVYFPYLIRWEYWKALATANQDFFDITEPNNGLNEFWQRYTTVGPWGLYYELTLNTTKNGETLVFNNEQVILATDYDTNPNWINESIKTYDPDTGAPLTGGGKDYILGYKDTRVEALLEYALGTPTLGNISVVFGIEVFEEGGIDGRRRLSSVWVKDSDTWFKSLDSSGKVKLSLVGDKVKAEALLDYTKLPIKQKFKITARLYDLSAGNPAYLFQDSGEYNFQDGFEYIFQDQ